MSPDKLRPWDDFWAKEQRGHGGCLPERSPAIEAAQQRAWQTFATSLVPRAKLIDLATGDGRVMRWMLQARHDLKMVGIDLAATIPPPPKGTRSRGGVAMEALPFASNSQIAVTSQFGIEYGDVGAVLGETARVLKAGGKAAFMTHQLAGPLIKHNRKRRDGLRWVTDEQSLIAKARGSLSLRTLGIAVPPVLAAAPAEAARQFGAGSGGWELAEAIRQTLDRGRNDNAAAVERLLGELESKARAEIERLNALEAAAEAVRDGAGFIEKAKRHGLSLIAGTPIAEDKRTPAFADFRIFIKG